MLVTIQGKIFPDFPRLIPKYFQNSLTFPDFAEEDTFFPDFQDSMNPVIVIWTMQGN